MDRIRCRLTLMFTCKQVSRILHNEDYAKLSPLKRFFLNLHIKLCIVCGKFNKQVIEGQDMCCNYKKHEEAGLSQQTGMDPARKEALKKLLSEQSSDSDPRGT